MSLARRSPGGWLLLVACAGCAASGASGRDAAIEVGVGGREGAPATVPATAEVAARRGAGTGERTGEGAGERTGEGAGERTGEGAGEPGRPADAKANYALEIDAPPALARLIRANTLLGRWQYRDDFEFGQRALFVRRAPDEIRQLLATEGYFEPEVEIDASLFKVSVRVRTGVRSTINRVRLGFDGEILDPSFARRRRQVEQAWALPEGSFFTQRAWDGAKRDLLNGLRNEGFAHARIRDSRAAVDLEKTAVSLDLTVDAGPLTRVGRIRYEGLERYAPALLVPLQRFASGDVYSLRALQEFQARMRDTRWFSSVNVRPDLAALEADPTRREVDIRVELVEAQSERLTLGIGYSTDRGVRGQVGWIDRNWLGRAWQLDSRLIVDDLVQQAGVNVRTPLSPRGHYVSAGVSAERQDIQNTIDELGAVFVGRGRQLGDIEFFASLTQQGDRQITIDVDGARQYVSRRALVPGYSWNVRRLDSRLYPTRGYTFNAQLSGAVEGVLSTANFFRGYARVLRFVPMPAGSALNGGVLLLMGEAGAVVADSRDGIPSQNLFRAGGSQSVRGYAYQSLGIRRGVSIIGGRYLVVGSVEYQHPTAIDDLAAAVFYDRGGVGDNGRDLRTVAGYGVGARWRTPVGPINLDVAWGQSERSLRWHLSIGYTF